MQIKKTEGITRMTTAMGFHRLRFERGQMEMRGRRSGSFVLVLLLELGLD